MSLKLLQFINKNNEIVRIKFKINIKSKKLRSMKLLLLLNGEVKGKEGVKRDYISTG